MAKTSTKKEKPKLVFKKKTKRMNFHIDGEQGIVVVRQYWTYTYKPNTAAWKDIKKNFHKSIEKVIRKAWNGKFVLGVEGTSDFAQYLKGKTLDVSFDIDPVTSKGHWEVIARKLPAGKNAQSKVNWNKQQIWLDTRDDEAVKKKGAPDDVEQVPAAHEFGHAIGNHSSTNVGHSDEYKDSSSFKAHKRSIMNVGMTVKKRHADYLVEQLNQMIPDTMFSVRSVK